MSIRIFPIPEETTEAGANIKVIGVGGAGGNAVNRMISENVQGVEFVVINTDFQDLQKSWGETKIQIGAQLTGGLGSGGDPEIGLKAIEENEDDVKLTLEGANMVFVAAGMGTMVLALRSYGSVVKRVEVQVETTVPVWAARASNSPSTR